MIKRFAFTISFILSSLCLLYSQNDSIELKIQDSELNMLEGDWEGMLTYTDYQSGKPYSMPAHLSIKWSKKNQVLILSHRYPNEPKANNSEKIKISKDRKKIGNKTITSKNELLNGQIQFECEFEGKDNNKKALIKKTYMLSPEMLIIKKEIRSVQKDQWLLRNEYNYKRIN